MGSCSDASARLCESMRHENLLAAMRWAFCSALLPALLAKVVDVGGQGWQHCLPLDYSHGSQDGVHNLRDGSLPLQSMGAQSY